MILFDFKINSYFMQLFFNFIFLSEKLLTTPRLMLEQYIYYGIAATDISILYSY